MKCLRLLVFLFCATKIANAANIFALLPTPSISHQVVYRVFLHELNKRGHNLTVATPDPIKDSKLKNYREIDLNYGYKFLRSILDVSSETGRKNSVSEMFLVISAIMVSGLCNMYLSDPNLMSIYNNQEKYDLFIFEWGLYKCFYPFAKLSDGKMIGIASYEMGSIARMALGNPSNPAYVPDSLLEYSNQMTFLQRLRSNVFTWTTSIYAFGLKWHENNIARKYFGPDTPHLDEFEKNVSLVFDNNHPAMSYPRASHSNFISFGGPPFHLTGHKPKPLPKDLQDFMDSAEHGVIYFSLGTNVKTSNISSKEEKIILESFGKIKQKVLWKWENENLVVNLKNVKVGKWFPQVDILAHPKVKGFVTQAGLQSIGEAIEFNVPMILMPFFADQNHNAKKMELVGAGIYLDFGALTLDDLVNAMNQIVYNKTYKENIKKFSQLVKDQPIPPLEKAVWWTEYVIRHNGAPHLRSTAASMPWYQYFLLDVLAVCLLALIIIVIIFVITITTTKRLIFGSKKENKSKKTN